MSSPAASFPADRELVLQRVLNASREKLYRCWTTPELVVQWFTPPPFQTVRAVMDVRAGGASCITMRSPDGQEFPNPGIYLEVVPNEKLVFTDAYTGPITANPANPAGGSLAWCAEAAPVTSVVDLNAYAGQTIRLRFRVATDGNTGTDAGFRGWFLDDFNVQSCQ